MNTKTNKEKGMVVPKEEVKEVASVESFITKAIEQNVSVETMEKLFSLREKVKNEQAKSAFVRAMANFQSLCPVIKKTKKVLNKDGRTTRYQYAPIDTIIDQIKGALKSSDLSYTWNVVNEEGFIKAIATITHILGHSETSEFKVPIDTEGYMTSPQKYASALTFAKRYSLCNALGIATADEDTDATDVGKQSEVKSSKSKIMFSLRALGYETKTKEQIERAITEKTQLVLNDKNLDEIVGRLEILVQEKNEYENSKVSK